VTPLPAIHDLSRAGAVLSLELELTADLPVFAGHFPDTPILPAVAQIGWALQLAREHFELPREFRALHSLKFVRIVQPPGRLALTLTRASDGRTVSFAYSQSGSACSTGRIEFTDDASRPGRSFL
jgi:3-hydroxymyristoyl/3-hydroxydecanoyl-(acyl carrier protein) dehydratase